MYKPFFFQCMRLLIVIASLLSLYIFIKHVFLLFYPFLLALFFSYVMNPVVTYLENKLKFPRIFATFIVVCFLFVSISGFSLLIFTELIESTNDLAANVPAHFETLYIYVDDLVMNKIIPLYQRLTSFIHTLNEAQQHAITDQIKQLIRQITTSGTALLSNMLLKIPAFLTMIPYSISMFIFTMIATFLITNDWHSLKILSQKAIPKHLKYTSRNLLTHFGKAVTGFFKAQFILISISAFITIIGLLFLKVDHALTIGLLIALVDLLPLLGTGIVFVPWIGYLFLTANYPLTIGLTILYMIIIISRQVLEPKVIAVNIGLHPLAALLILFISLQFWGLIGIIIAPFLLILTHACYKSGFVWQVWHFIKGEQS